MSDLKITVDQLKNYLGVGLELKVRSVAGVDHGTDTMIGICDNMHDGADILVKTKNGFTTDYKIQFAIPICYRLSDLDKEIEHNGERFVPVAKLFPIDTEFERSAGITSMDYMQYMLNDGFKSFHYELIQKLFEWHFWPFGDEYFEQGLVIDKMKITKK